MGLKEEEMKMGKIRMLDEKALIIPEVKILFVTLTLAVTISLSFVRYSLYIHLEKLRK